MTLERSIETYQAELMEKPYTLNIMRRTGELESYQFKTATIGLKVMGNLFDKYHSDAYAELVHEPTEQVIKTLIGPSFQEPKRAA